MTTRSLPPVLPTPLPPWHQARGLSRITRELVDHLLPWDLGDFRHHTLVQIGSTLLAGAATLVWWLAASGQTRGLVVIAWWLAWSAMETWVRCLNKPYVKEGPWWGRQLRPAGVMDMICYVGFKNLLLGSALFLTLKALGWLHV